MQEEKSKFVTQKHVNCNGGEGSSGHPKIYLNMGEKDFIICPYCGFKFIFKND